MFFHLGHVFVFVFVWEHLLHIRGGSLSITSAGQPTFPRCGAVCSRGVREVIMPLSGTSLVPTSHLGPSGADSWVDGFVYVPEPCGTLQRILV